MPFPNEHAARLKNPNNFDKDTFRRKKDGTIYGSKKVPASVAVIWGKLKGKAAPGDNPIPQSLRFLTSDWTVAAAKKWLKDNEIKYTLFEPASESKSLDGDGERRNLTDVEIRVVDGEDGKPMIRGYGAVFGAESVGLPFREIVDQGAFTESVLKDDIVGLFNHDPNFVLGRKSAKTMRVEEDMKGLRFEIDPPDTGMGRDVPVLIRRGDVRGASFRFLVKPGGEHWEGDGEDLTRHLTNLRLMDVSPATFPAYPSTSVAARSLDRYLEERETAECEPAWRTELRRLRLKLVLSDHDGHLTRDDNSKKKQLEDFEYLIHHIESEEGEEEVHHCYLYDHLGNLFEHVHLTVDGDKIELDGKKVTDGTYHVISRLEPDQEVCWSDEEALEADITPKEMFAGMTLEEKSKEW